MSINNNNANKLASLGYEYDRENDVYFKVDENNKIEYQVNIGKLTIKKFERKSLKNISYYSSSKLITLTSLNNKSELITNLKYDVPLNEMYCYKSNCENYRSDINYILKVYREISKTLQ